MNRVTARGIASLLLVLAFVGCRAPDPDAVSSNEFMVQWEAMAGQFELVQDGSRASRATGSVRTVFRDANGDPLLDATGTYVVRGTCGVTFISPRYAITAAHCVDFVRDPEVDRVAVETYEVTGIDDPEAWLYLGGRVDDFFPNYKRDVRLEEIFDYYAQSYQCIVSAWCTALNHYNCQGADADIALLNCPDRDPEADWLPVAQGDQMSGPLEMYWFHEVLAMPVSDPGAGDPQEHDHFEHYTQRFGVLRDNFHYLEADANLLLPLKSVRWSDSVGGAERTRVGLDGTVGVFTDLFGCHGTSGSGVLQANGQGELELLGPVLHGAGDWVASLLCNTSTGFSPGDASLSYGKNTVTREFEGLFIEELDLDRKGTCGCANSGVGQICQASVNLCKSGFGPHCNPAQGNYPTVSCGGCTCE